MSASSHLTGLSDQVHDSQMVFRTALQSMARPGLPRLIDVDLVAPPPLSVPVAALALTFFDSGVNALLASAYDHMAVRTYLTLNSGVSITDDPARADFVLASSDDEVLFENLKPIDPRTPYKSSTVILQIGSLTDGDAVTLTGPGIEHEVVLRTRGLPSNFWAQWDRNVERYPRGVDVILADDRHLCCLPRTTRRA